MTPCHRESSRGKGMGNQAALLRRRIVKCLNTPEWRETEEVALD
jgi:hypothetical protein